MVAVVVMITMLTVGLDDLDGGEQRLGEIEAIAARRRMDIVEIGVVIYVVIGLGRDAKASAPEDTLAD